MSLYPSEVVEKLEARARSAQNFIQGILPYSLRDGNRLGGDPMARLCPPEGLPKFTGKR